MDQRLKFKLHRMSVWSGVVVLTASTVAFPVVGKLSPPISPTASAVEVAKFLTENRTGILLAAVIMGVSAPFFYAFAVIFVLNVAVIGFASLVDRRTAYLRGLLFRPSLSWSGRSL